ncbi:hypothetical protein [Laspinema olomoucense]|uniref:hypothetical protein n=1 Tax=Laspinema olomoucense TaxID=3231600 RepID=UPI0021BA92FD|nr:hypothetical protein [Laspinema sp. D3d]MCT7975431.1 hypothetical protein [Laspinema sp. D3d]
MEDWEFLIQKEGDRAWLSVESPEVEILEGRYRMVARCSRNNVPVEIRAIYQSSEEFPPKRRMQKRGTRTNGEGLMVVIPFTRLKPGFWDFTCFLDQTTQGSIRVEVLSIEEEGDSDFSGGLTSAGFQEGTESDREEEFSDLEGDDRLQAAAEAVAEDEAAGVAEEQNPGTPTPAADPSLPGKLYAFPDRLPSLAEGSRTSPPLVPPSPPPAQPQKLPPLQLVLQRETYMVKWGKVLTLEGRIEAVDGKAGDRISGLELRVMLQNPQTGAKIVEVGHPLSEGTLPMTFSCPVEIPEQTKSHLLLGEVSLSDASGTQLRRRSFTITADLDDLLGAISPDLSEEKLLEHSRESIHQQNVEEIDASFDEILETIKKSQPISFEPSGNQVLPPQIVKPQAKSPQAGKPLDLPTFKRPQPPAPAEEVKLPDPAIAIPAEPETPPPSAPVPQELPTTPAETEATAPSLEVKSEPDQGAKKASPVDQAFQSLHLQDRFFSRLNALASDRELSDWLKISFTPVSEESEDNPFEMDEAIAAATGEERYSEGSLRMPPEPEEIDWEAREIVVDDELLAEASVTAANAKAEGAALLLLPEDQPVPNPRLSLPKGELSAGRSVKVTVQLPQMLPRIYVKLWVLDRQSRTVLDGPHWLTQFWPTGFGDVEGSRELMVPYGSLQVQFEAIAVEMQTQRESHKVSLERQILPPSPPSLPL